MRELFTTQNQTLIRTLEQLAILEARFEETIVHSVYVDWKRWLSNFSCLKSTTSQGSNHLLCEEALWTSQDGGPEPRTLTPIGGDNNFHSDDVNNCFLPIAILGY